MGHAPPLDDASRVRLARRARLLFAGGVAYNVVEAGIALSARTGSSALLAFGLDATVEVLSGLVVLASVRRVLTPDREQRALRLVALCFFALGAWVTMEAVLSLGDDPSTSRAGLALAAVSLAVMPALARAQRRTGELLHSTTVVAGSGQARLCSWMSAALLLGLALDAGPGWSWADPVAGLVIAALAVREGRSAWRGEPCCHPGE